MCKNIMLNKRVNYLLQNKKIHHKEITFGTCYCSFGLDIVKYIHNHTHDMKQSYMNYLSYNNLYDNLRFFHLNGFMLNSKLLLTAHQGQAIECVNYMLSLGLRLSYIGKKNPCWLRLTSYPDI